MNVPRLTSPSDFWREDLLLLPELLRLPLAFCTGSGLGIRVSKSESESTSKRCARSTVLNTAEVVHGHTHGGRDAQ